MWLHNFLLIKPCRYLCMLLHYLYVGNSTKIRKTMCGSNDDRGRSCTWKILGKIDFFVDFRTKNESFLMCFTSINTTIFVKLFHCFVSLKISLFSKNNYYVDKTIRIKKLFVFFHDTYFNRKNNKNVKIH